MKRSRDNVKSTKKPKLEIYNGNYEGEIWKKSPYYEFVEFYVSSYGRVCTLYGVICKSHITDSGKPYVAVRYTNPVRKTKIAVERVVISAFLGRKDHLKVVHKDSDITNNRADNLKYETE